MFETDRIRQLITVLDPKLTIENTNAVEQIYNALDSITERFSRVMREKDHISERLEDARKGRFYSPDEEEKNEVCTRLKANMSIHELINLERGLEGVRMDNGTKYNKYLTK